MNPDLWSCIDFLLDLWALGKVLQTEERVENSATVPKYVVLMCAVLKCAELSYIL